MKQIESKNDINKFGELKNKEKTISMINKTKVVLRQKENLNVLTLLNTILKSININIDTFLQEKLCLKKQGN